MNQLDKGKKNSSSVKHVPGLNTDRRATLFGFSEDHMMAFFRKKLSMRDYTINLEFQP
jgi:hypothetical protein